MVAGAAMAAGTAAAVAGAAMAAMSEKMTVANDFPQTVLRFEGAIGNYDLRIGKFTL